MGGLLLCFLFFFLLSLFAPLYVNVYRGAAATRLIVNVSAEDTHKIRHPRMVAEGGIPMSRLRISAAQARRDVHYLAKENIPQFLSGMMSNPLALDAIVTSQ